MYALSVTNIQLHLEDESYWQYIQSIQSHCREQKNNSYMIPKLQNVERHLLGTTATETETLPRFVCSSFLLQPFFHHMFFTVILSTKDPTIRRNIAKVMKVTYDIHETTYMDTLLSYDVHKSERWVRDIPQTFHPYIHVEPLIKRNEYLELFFTPDKQTGQILVPSEKVIHSEMRGETILHLSMNLNVSVFVVKFKPEVVDKQFHVRYMEYYPVDRKENEPGDDTSLLRSRYLVFDKIHQEIDGFCIFRIQDQTGMTLSLSHINIRRLHLYNVHQLEDCFAYGVIFQVFHRHVKWYALQSFPVPTKPKISIDLHRFSCEKYLETTKYVEQQLDKNNTTIAEIRKKYYNLFIKESRFVRRAAIYYMGCYGEVACEICYDVLDEIEVKTKQKYPKVGGVKNYYTYYYYVCSNCQLRISRGDINNVAVRRVVKSKEKKRMTPYLRLKTIYAVLLATGILQRFYRTYVKYRVGNTGYNEALQEWCKKLK